MAQFGSTRVILGAALPGVVRRGSGRVRLCLRENRFNCEVVFKFGLCALDGLSEVENPPKGLVPIAHLSRVIAVLLKLQLMTYSVASSIRSLSFGNSVVREGHIRMD